MKARKFYWLVDEATLNPTQTPTRRNHENAVKRKTLFYIAIGIMCAGSEWNIKRVPKGCNRR